MSNYSTLLKTWGDTGSEYPAGYFHLEGEQPVDAWDNFLKYNIVEDLKHLIELTNDRIESDTGAAGSEPTNPEQSHLYHDLDNESLKFWDSTASKWNRLLAAGGDTLEGSLNFAGYAAQNVGPLSMSGTFDVDGQNIVDGATTLYDASSGKFSDADTVDGKHASDLGSDAYNNGSLVLENANLDFGSNLSVTDNADGSVTIDAAQAADTHTAISENGSQIVSSVNDVDFIGHLNVIDDGDGTVTIDPTHNHDSRYYQPDGNDEFVVENRTSDPSSPVSGRSWIRTDI